MNVVTRVRAVPRSIVGAGLGLARLPVTAAAVATRQRANEEWPPALAFEGFEAGVETVVGSLLRDDTLVERGRVRQAKVAQVRKALQLETVADQQRERADAEFRTRQERAEQQRQQAEQRAEQLEQQVEQEAARREQQVRQTAAKKAAANRQVKAKQDEALRRQEREAKAAALAEEAEAIEAQKDALDAQETIEVIDESIEGTKAARQTG
jgi:hypothetical protein